MVGELLSLYKGTLGNFEGLQNLSTRALEISKHPDDWSYAKKSICFPWRPHTHLTPCSELTFTTAQGVLLKTNKALTNTWKYYLSSTLTSFEQRL